MKNTRNLFRLFILAVIICLPALSNAQPPDGDDVNDVPLDGGLSLLIASGVGYGIKKVHEHRKKTTGFSKKN